MLRSLSSPARAERRPARRQHKRRRAALALALFLTLLARGRAGAEEPDAIRGAGLTWAWQRVEAALGRGDAAAPSSVDGSADALAADSGDRTGALGAVEGTGLDGASGGRRVAVGPRGALAWSDGRGVERRLDGGAERAALAGTTALAFDAAGALWIGSAAGLHVWPTAGRPERRRLPGGELANRVLALASRDGELVVATAAGAFWSPPPPPPPPSSPGTEPGSSRRLFQALDAGGVATPVVLAALRGRAPERAQGGAQDAALAEVWLLSVAGLERVVGLRRASGLRVLGRDRWPLPRPRAAGGPVDLRVEWDAGASRLVLAYPDALLHRRLGPPGAPEREAGVWRTLRPVLAPGVRIRRALLDRTGGVVLAGSRGLFEATSLDASFARVSGEAGFEACDDLTAPAAGAIHAICRSGLFRRVAVEESVAWDSGSPSGVSSPTAAAGAAERDAWTAAASAAERDAPAPPRRPLPPDPPLAEIRRRALERAGLAPERIRGLWRGLARRGLWPDLSLRFGADLDRDERRFADQSFVSGDTRDLFDHTRERGGAFEASIALDWALGDFAYPDDAVDLSREQRQVVSLRDDVADELHQLYFERARLRERLADPAPLASEEERALRQRAAELLAGLDAWTGGWVARWQADQAPTSPLRPRPPGPPSLDQRYAP